MKEPLLAEKVNLEKLVFPVMTSDKLDGFRCLIHPTLGPVTRKFKPLANNYVRGKLAELPIQYLDGEVLTYTGDKMDDFNTVQSKLSSRQGMPEFVFHVFDHFENPHEPFVNRYTRAGMVVQRANNLRVVQVPHDTAHNLETLLEWESRALAHGYEGLMIRKIDGKYKFGRSTVNEGILLKLKRRDEDEGIVAGYYELRHNGNEAVRDEVGQLKRSSVKEGMVPMGVLGGFTLDWKGLQFDLGTGFDQNQREAYWLQRDLAIGKKVTFTYQGVGSNGKPRFPSFRGFRSDL
jgi:DNA ligase-1